MLCYPNRYCVFVCLSLVALLIHADRATAEDWPSITPKLGAAEQRILEELDTDTRLEFIETPLNQVVEFLKDLHNIKIELDRKALDDVGIGTDVPITRNLKGICLRSALHLMLRDLELTYVISDEVLLITTAEGAAARARVKVYNVSALLDEGETAESVVMPLLQILQPAEMSAPRRYGGMGGMPSGFGGNDSGGFGAGETARGGEAIRNKDAQSIMRSARRVVPFKQLLIVRDTTAGHKEIVGVLQCLAEALKRKP